MAVFFLIGIALRLGWRLARWWVPLVFVTVQVGGGAHPIAIAISAGLLALWWPPTRWAWDVARGRGGQGGVQVGNGKRATSERARQEARRARVERVSMGAEPPPRKWAVDKLVPCGPRPRWRLRWHPVFLERVERGYITAVIGSGGSGKSYLLLDLAIAALTGGTWLGRAVSPCRSVLYVDAELDIDTLRERGWQVARGRRLARPPGPAHWWQLPWSWIRPRGLFYLAMPVSIATEEGQALVRRTALRCKADLVLFDSLTIGAAGTALADSDGWNDVLTGMEGWGRPVVCIDHTPKSGHGQVGSFMKHAKIRAQLELERQKDATVSVAHEKANFGPKLPPWAVRPVFAVDDPATAMVRFDALTSDGLPVVAPESSVPAAQASAPRPKWGKREQAVLDAYAARAAGGTVKEVADELAAVLGNRAVKTVGEAVRRLEKAGALLKVETVPTPGGGPPAGRYVAAAHVATSEVAVAQAEQLLRAALHPSGGES